MKKIMKKKFVKVGKGKKTVKCKSVKNSLWKSRVQFKIYRKVDICESGEKKKWREIALDKVFRWHINEWMCEMSRFIQETCVDAIVCETKQKPKGNKWFSGNEVV